MLASRDLTLDAVLAELDRRAGTSGIAEKAGRRS
jgi:phosphoribosyl-ATP pyrophosphohydrolase